MTTFDESGFTTFRFERHDRVLKVIIDNPASDINAVDNELHSQFALLFVLGSLGPSSQAHIGYRFAERETILNESRTLIERVERELGYKPAPP